MSAVLTKRGAEFPLEKLCFEREHVGSDGKASTDIVKTSLFKAPTGRPYRAGKRMKLSLSRVPEEEAITMEVGPESGVREVLSGDGCMEEAVNNVDVVSDGTPWGSGCWLGFTRIRRAVSSADQPLDKDIAAPSGRPLVQLKIDAMFTGGSSQKAGPRAGKPTEDAPQDGVEAIEGRTTVQGGMDVDTTTTTVVSPSDRDEGVPPCYVCTGSLGTEGGDILCAFCDRAACQACSMACAACEIPHCSLCLAADFSSHFERYFCPSCCEDRQRDECEGADEMVD